MPKTFRAPAQQQPSHGVMESGQALGSFFPKSMAGCFGKGKKGCPVFEGFSGPSAVALSCCRWCLIRKCLIDAGDFWKSGPNTQVLPCTGKGAGHPTSVADGLSRAMRPHSSASLCHFSLMCRFTLSFLQFTVREIEQYSFPSPLCLSVIIILSHVQRAASWSCNCSGDAP